jgi:hypothetical protein
MTNKEIAELRKTDPIPGGSTFPGGLPRGGSLAVLPHDLLVRLVATSARRCWGRCGRCS